MSGTVIPPAGDTGAWITRTQVAALAELVLGLPVDLDHADLATLRRLRVEHGLEAADLWPGHGPDRVRVAVRAIAERRRRLALHAASNQPPAMCARGPHHPSDVQHLEESIHE